MKLTKEEQKLVDEGILNKKVLLKAPPKIRARWVSDANIYKPPYIDETGEVAAKSRYKPYMRTYGAGTGKK